MDVGGVQNPQITARSVPAGQISGGGNGGVALKADQVAAQVDAIDDPFTGAGLQCLDDRAPITQMHRLGKGNGGVNFLVPFDFRLGNRVF